jgi:micrococcal nuclease
MEGLVFLTLLAGAVGALFIIIIASRDSGSTPSVTGQSTSGDSVSGQSGPDHHTASVAHIIDGDTVIVSVDGWEERLRLDAIDCPEDGQLWGDTAKYGLIKLIGGRSIRFLSHGRDRYDRILATIFVFDVAGDEWINVNDRMVIRGHAWVSRLLCNHLPRERQEELLRKQRWARSKGVGLWRHPNPIPPWKWRNEN